MASELNFDSFGFLDNVWDMDQSNWSDYFYPSIPDGVVAGIGSEMQVTADSSGMNVAVGTGECRVRSHRGALTASKTLTISTASSANPRIDLIVARVNYLTSTVTIAVKTGTAASSPTAPTVTQNAGDVWEIPLAQVAVAKNATTIAATDITDARRIVRTGTQVKIWSSGTSLTPANDCEYRRTVLSSGWTCNLPPLDPSDVWMTSVNFPSHHTNYSGITFKRAGADYSPKVIGDSLTLKNKRYNIVIWWDGSFFWVAVKAM